MHNLEPFYNWRDQYTSENDEHSPFYGREYDEFKYTQKIYNYYIHPQWDEFGSPTLYLKIIYADYSREFCIIELIGEWNDAINNDIMHLKREVIDVLIREGISKFIIIGENVLNFHCSDDCYYQEWFEDIEEEDGWVVAINFREHILEEMRNSGIHHYIHFSEDMKSLSWRKFKPESLCDALESGILQQLV